LTFGDLCEERGRAQAAVLGAFHGGKDGVILSRNYSEMKLDNMRAAGAALKRWNLAKIREPHPKRIVVNCR
jgi:hypothetical protein